MAVNICAKEAQQAADSVIRKMGNVFAADLNEVEVYSD